MQYNIIQYKTCNAPYVTRMLFVLKFQIRSVSFCDVLNYRTFHVGNKNIKYNH